MADKQAAFEFLDFLIRHFFACDRVEQSQDQAGCLHTDVTLGLVQSGQWRIGVSGENDVIETYHREILRHMQAVCLQAFEHTDGQHVIETD